MIILSYHQFYELPNEYQYSRTYVQFANDLATKEFDLITVDDGHKGCLKAFEMLKERGIRAILFVPTSLMNQGKYLSWDEIAEISKYHEIGNHSHHHINLMELSIAQIHDELTTANYLIKKYTGKIPVSFVPPYNKANKHVENIAEKLGLKLINNRIDILNTTP